MEYYIEENLRDLVASVVKSHDKKRFSSKEGDFSPQKDLWQRLSEHGLIGVGIPEEYGGGNGGLEASCIVAEELAQQDHLPVLFVMSPGIVGSILLNSGTVSQKKRYLPGIADGSLKVCFAITEPEAGSNTHRVSTSLTESAGGNFSLSGTKCFISGADQAEMVLVVAKLPHPEGGEQVGWCLVPTDAPGLTMSEIQTEGFSEDKQWLLSFDSVPVSKADVVDPNVSGMKALFHGLNPERVLMASFCNGIGLRALTEATKYAESRKVWDGPISTHQAISHPLAEAKIEVELARNMTRFAAKQFDSGEDCAEHANYAKYAAAKAAVKSVDRAIQTLGGNGFTKDYGVSKLYWPARLFRTAPVSEEMILNYVANNVLGMTRSY